MAGRYGLLGSGEFLPWAEPVDRWMASGGGGRGGRVLVVPTASAPEGDEVFWRWGSKGLSHYRKLGLETAVVGDGGRWEVRGRGTATVQPAGADPFVVNAGDRFDLTLRSSLL